MPPRKRHRKKPSDGRTRAAKPATRDKAEQAWLLRLRGESLEDIGRQLGGMVPSSVHELLSGYVRGRPLADIEDYRKLLLCRLDALYVEAWETLQNEDGTKGRCDAIRTMRGLVRDAAIISGAVKQSPPVVMVNQFPNGQALSRLSIEDVEALRGMQTKIIEAPIVVQAETVEEHDDDSTAQRDDEEPHE